LAWDTDATPELGDTPQGVINRQLVGRSDLLIAIFWTRLGSPTESAISGTVEEIEEHIKSGKPVMLYFSAKPCDPTKIEPRQHEALNRFRDEIRNRGLYEDFADEADFRKKFTRQLASKAHGFRQLVPLGVARAVPNESQVTKANQGLSELPEEAKQLLLLAAAEHSGFISSTPLQSGVFAIGVGAQYGIRSHFGTFTNDQARSILEELERRELIEPLNNKKTEYRITAKGVKLACATDSA
jgi:hypothetical protein